MIYSPLRSIVQRISIFRGVGILLFAGLLLGALGGCDTVTVQSSEDIDDEVRNHELRVDTESFSQIDLLFDAGAIPEGESLTIELIDDDYDRPATRITHEGLSNGEKRLLVDFNPLDPSTVNMECRKDTKTMYRDDITLPDNEPSAEWDFGMKVATTQDEPDSYHYEQQGDDVVVSVDYEDKQSKSNGVSGETSVQFSTLDKPVSCSDVLFTLGGVSRSLSPNGVRFRGATETPTFHKKVFK